MWEANPCYLIAFSLFSLSPWFSLCYCSTMNYVCVNHVWLANYVSQLSVARIRASERLRYMFLMTNVSTELFLEDKCFNGTSGDIKYRTCRYIYTSTQESLIRRPLFIWFFSKVSPETVESRDHLVHCPRCHPCFTKIVHVFTED